LVIGNEAWVWSKAWMDVFFVHAQHHGVLRRVQVEPDNVDELLLEQRVVRELERLDQVRLEAAPGPDPLNGGRTDPDLFGH
jgi:hypothetical protein